jgi:hypothetical protein
MIPGFWRYLCAVMVSTCCLITLCDSAFSGSMLLTGVGGGSSSPPPVTTTFDATFNAGNLTFSNGNLTATAPNTGPGNYYVARSVASHTTGKYYMELTGSDPGSFIGVPGTCACYVAVTMPDDTHISWTANFGAPGYAGTVPSGFGNW